jgi:hypothetical protein
VEFLVLLLLVVVIVAVPVTISANRRNRRSLQKTQISLHRGAEVVRQIERDGRRTMLRNFAIAIGVFGALFVLFMITGVSK